MTSIRITIGYICTFLISCISYAAESPFEISFPAKSELTQEDYIEIQNQLRQLDTHSPVEALYSPIQFSGFTDFKDFLGRCSRGARQVLIDPEKGFYPVKELVKIGKGGDRCVVCCGPFSGKYPYYINSLIQALQDTGFNGHFLYLIGGWPNPTGEEIKYVAVPYSFKIFTMLEAYMLGFNHVLWLDAACLPMREISSLFNVIENNGALLNFSSPAKDSWRFIFPQTKDLLKQKTGTNVLKAQYINTIVFGLKMNTPETRKLVRIYYELAQLGTPFLSCYPEEWVLTAIIGKPEFAHWKKKKPHNLLYGVHSGEKDSTEHMEKARRKKTYFYHRQGR
ncbi:MAG: hypothetical protein K2Y01_10050 [Rhabdochlamydiaceae bacterium]|nr:hypothetical protein [Rhabdochlamydiaceae bacterium]